MAPANARRASGVSHSLSPQGEGRGEGSKQEKTLDNSRWRCFTRDYIRDQKGDSLDISWIKDEDSVDAASLSDPDVLAAEAMGELTEALRELDGLMQALGAGDEAVAQRELLVEALGLEAKGLVL
jgi:type I restriction enzyme M protein